MVSECSGAISDKMEQSLRQKVAKVEDGHQAGQRLADTSFTKGSRLKMANLVYSRRLHFQVTCQIQTQRQEVYCAYLDHTRLFQFPGCVRSKPQFLTAAQSLKKFRWTQVYVSMDYQLFNFGVVSWKHDPASEPSETLNATHAKESFRHTHVSDSCVFLSQIDHGPHNIPDSSHSTQLSQFEDNAAVIQMINKGRSPNLRHVTRTHRVDLDWLLVSQLGSFFFVEKNVRSIGGYFDKGNVHHYAVDLIADFLANQTT